MTSPAKPLPYIAKISGNHKFLGSGVVVDRHHILTCEHVVRGFLRKPLTVLIGQHAATSGSVGPVDKENDLALIQLEKELDVEPPAWSSAVEIDQRCNALGYPNGAYEAPEVKVKNAQRRLISLEAELEPGMSGGTLVRLIAGEPYCVGLLQKSSELAVSKATGAQGVIEFLTRHNIALPERPPAPTRTAADRELELSTYLDRMRKQTREIPLHELKIEDAPVPRMDALYFPLTTHDATDEPRGEEKGDMRGHKEVRLEEALRQHRHLLIEGGPGSGKTTFMHRIAWALCREDADPQLKLDFRGVPLLIRISELDQHVAQTCAGARMPGDPTTSTNPRWIAHFLASRANDISREFYEEQLAQPDHVLLLDGLDEAATPERRADILKLIDLSVTTHACRHVVTTRPSADDHKTSRRPFRTVQIQDLDRAKIRTFLERWSLWLKKGDETAARDHARELEAAVSVPGLRRVAANPLMLTALAVVHLQEHHLPEQRAALYEVIMQWLARQAAKRGNYSKDDCLRRLSTLALAMQEWERGHTLQVGIDAAARKIEGEFRRVEPDLRLEAARTFLENAHQESGILTLRGEQLRFWHRSFQEYLAARALVGLTEPWVRGARFLFAGEGREVLPLAAGRLAESDTERLDELFRQLMQATAGRPMRDRFHAVGVLGSMVRDLKSTSYRLAAEDQTTYDALLKWVLETLRKGRPRDVSLRDWVDAAEALGAAGDPRLCMPWQDGYWVEVQGGRFVLGAQKEHPNGEMYDKEADEDESVLRGTVANFSLGRYQVTVWEYGRYLQDLDENAERAATPDNWEKQNENPSRPVVNVDWEQARAYCRWAGAKCERTVRLPDETEWEYAARGQEARRYPWGPEPPDSFRANFSGAEAGAPTPVGIFPAGNTFEDGLTDMAGNVWEWTTSEYDTGRRVLRGGAFNYVGRYLRSAVRDRYEPDLRSSNLGFRCLRE